MLGFLYIFSFFKASHGGDNTDLRHKMTLINKLPPLPVSQVCVTKLVVNVSTKM